MKSSAEWLAFLQGLLGVSGGSGVSFSASPTPAVDLPSHRVALADELRYYVGHASPESRRLEPWFFSPLPGDLSYMLDDGLVLLLGPSEGSTPPGFSDLFVLLLNASEAPATAQWIHDDWEVVYRQDVDPGVSDIPAWDGFVGDVFRDAVSLYPQVVQILTK